MLCTAGERNSSWRTRTGYSVTLCLGREGSEQMSHSDELGRDELWGGRVFGIASSVLRQTVRTRL